MCGIAGVIVKDKNRTSLPGIEKMVRSLMVSAMARGQDASGVFFHSGTESLVLKRAVSARRLLKDPSFTSGLRKCFSSPEKSFLFLGQGRLVMSGSATREESNQPIIADGVLGLHNGIVTSLGGSPINLLTNLNHESDSYALFHEISRIYKAGSTSEEALKTLLSTTEGSYSTACFFKDSGYLYLSSNTGSLYYLDTEETFIFASEPNFISQFASSPENIQQVGPGEIIARTVKVLEDSEVQSLKSIRKAEDLKRCSRCILPHTYPLISFNQKGVCNFCQVHENQILHGEENLLKVLEKYRSKDGSADCLVGLSGGRDSSYGMYLLKKKYGMTPLAYTFDWGLTTDTSRRNQARVCGKLGIEHVIRAPDISERRRHVQKNVQAFMKRPHLGMVPLFMAGDKDFFHFGRKIRKERNLPVTIHCTGHEVERQHFKTGFCGVDDTQIHNVKLYEFSVLNKLRLAFFYVSQYALNPAYINESFYHSIRSFFYSFVGKDDFIYLFQYIRWDEKEIERVIKEEFGWESDAGYGKNQWRMGDGHTAFINYIYFTVAGFSEFDNFRANQVRIGQISREEALRLAEEDNRPKWESMEAFARIIGLNLEEVVKRINDIPQLR